MTFKKTALLFLIILFLSFLARHSRIDDSFIYARYIANALSGRGLVFNAGEHVNALTSPLYSYILLLLSWMTRGNVLLAQSIISFLGMFGTAYLAERKFPYSGFVLATTAYFYSFLGMETTLFTFFIMLAMTLYIEKRYSWLPLALILLCLTRFEGGALLVVVAWRLYKERTLPKLYAYIPAAAVGISYLLLNHHWYGKYLPSSALAKIGQGFSGYWGKWPYGFLDGHLRIIDMFSYMAALFLCLFVAGVMCLKGAPFNKVAIPFLSILFLFYFGLNVPDYSWYFAPFVLLFFVYGTAAVTHIKQIRPWMLTACLFVQFVGSVSWVKHSSSVTALNYIAASDWIAHNTPENAKIESVETGNIGWYSHRYLIDVIGLTTPKNAIHLNHRDVTSWLAEDNPDYIVVHNPAWPWEKVAAESHQYKAVFNAYDVEVLKRQGL